MFFNKKSQLEKLRGYKTLKINGMRFKIRRINPFVDFPLDQMPTIFTDFVSRHESNTDQVMIQKVQKDMQIIISKAVLEPILVPIGKDDKRGKEDGITTEDFFRDPDLGYKLYNAIMQHSLNRFSGLKGLFFSIRARYLSYMKWRKFMAKPLLN